jgi:hypothetical protein
MSLDLSEIWNGITKFTSWPRLQDLPWATTWIAEGLLQIEPGTYAFSVPYDLALRPVEPDNPYVTMFICCADASASRRVMLFDIEGDRGLPLDNVPQTLWSGEPACYRVVRETWATQKRTYRETGRYRIASDGIFIDRVLQSGQLKFFFRHVSGESEMAYAVSYSLPRTNA